MPFLDQAALFTESQFALTYGTQGVTIKACKSLLAESMGAIESNHYVLRTMAEAEYVKLENCELLFSLIQLGSLFF